MGLMTLSDFQIDVQNALGDKGMVNPKLDRWINAAYRRIANGINFEILEETTTFPTVNGTASYAEPSSNLIIRMVRNSTGDALLGWIPKSEYFRRTQATTGTPLYWSRQENLIYLWPVPTGVLTMLVFYKKEPTVLSAAADVTVLPASWDQVIFQLAVHYALMALGEEARGMGWLQTAIQDIQTRVTEEELHMTSAGLGKSMAGGVQDFAMKLQAQSGPSV